MGDATYNNGISLNGVTLNAAGGNITMIGTGYAAITSLGVALRGYTNMVETSGTGNISITGTGGSTAYQDHGIYLTADTNTIENTGSGGITLNGTGGTGGGGSSQNDGIVLAVGTQTILATGGGPIILNGVAGSGGGSYGLWTGATGTFTIGGASNTGNITLNQDSLLFNSGGGTTTIQTSGNVTIEPYTANTTVSVNSGASTLGLTTAYLGYITGESSLTIGSTADTGNMTVAQGTWGVPLTLVSGSGLITISGNQTMGSNNFTLETNVTPTFSGNVTTTGNVTLLPASAGTTIGVAGGTGNLAIGTGILGDITAGNLTIGNTADTGNMTLAAYSTWAQPTSFVTGSSGNITVSGNQTATGSGSFTFTGPTTLDANLTTAN